MPQAAEEVEDKEVEIILEEENSEGDATANATEQSASKENADDTELEEYSEGVKKRINKLTYKHREAERRETAAVEYAKGLQERINKLEAQNKVSDDRAFVEYQGRVESELEQAKQAVREAHEADDAEALITANQALAKLSVEEETIKRMGTRRETAEAEEHPNQASDSTHTPTTETAPEPDEKAVEWQGKNEWFGKDQAMTYAAFGIHKDLVATEGYDPTTDEYYQELDKRVQEAFPHRFETTEQASSRQNVGSAGGARVAAGGRRKVKLTPSQVNIAKRLGVPLEEYAKHVKEQ